MNKVSANASWTGLTTDQLKALDKWLFEEKQSYDAVLERAQKQLGYKGARSSLHRYFLRRRKERAVEEFKGVGDEVAAVNGAPADPDAVRKASMKVLVTVLFQQLRHSPENLKDMVPLAKLIVQNDYNELLREAKAQEFDLRREGYELRRELKAGDHRIRCEAIEFGKEKFRYDMIENAVKALPELQKVVEAMGEADSARYRESTNKVKQIMFAPGPEVLPGNKPEQSDAKETRNSCEGSQSGTVEVPTKPAPKGEE